MTVHSYSADWLSQFRRKISKWYESKRRPLPWRETSDAYAIWISETMLQQTQVATVIDYYLRFMQRFPSARTLAQASEEEVLQLWAGLGYYRRARQLHAAAKVIAQDFNGEFPKHFDDVLGLPGVGRYTAGAVMSIAFDARTPIVEANTARLYSRLLALRAPLQTRAAQDCLWEFAQAILPQRGGSGRINQAAMELGNQICKPQAPDCRACPLQSLCPTYAGDLAAEIPAPAPKKLISNAAHVAVLIERRGQLLMRQNQHGEWWQGLWDFPRACLGEASSEVDFDPQDLASSVNLQITRRVIRQTHALDCQPLRHAKTIQHSVTRYRISLHCYYASLASDSIDTLSGAWRWLGPNEQLALCAPAKRLRQWLQS